MTAQVVQLDTPIRMSSIHCNETGVRFPQIFRRREEGKPTIYTFYREDIRDRNYVLINQLVPGIDDCWLFVRHHCDERHFLGYMDALMDGERGKVLCVISMDNSGIYSLYSHPPTKGVENNLMIYSTNVIHPDIEMGLVSINHTQVIRHDGTVHDETYLLTPEERTFEDALQTETITK